MISLIKYFDQTNCLQISNGTSEILATTDVGPRVLRYAFKDGENILGEHAEASVHTALGEWKPFGGHRFWIAPEHMPNSHAPDNSPIDFFVDETNNSVRLVQSFESVTKTQKEIIITLDQTGCGVRLEHKISNRGTENIELAPWALTIMRGGGTAIVPNEPFAPYGANTLLPVRNFTVWSYTDFTDSRWSFDKDAIRLRVDESKPEPQKIGILNKQGWAAYEWEDLRFTKRFEYIENAVYPDYNSNTELYTAGSFVEVETLGPLQNLAPGQTATHVERWELLRI